MQNKRHYKMYKKGKLWCCSAIVLTMAFIGLATPNKDINADITTTQQERIATTSPSVVNTPSDQNVDHANEKDRNLNLTANVGNLDSYQLTENTTTGEVTLDLAGWHACGESQNQPYRFAILFDNTKNVEISRQALQAVDRPDVEQVYTDIPGVSQAGFNSSFNLPANTIDHTFSLITRYSDNPSGEGNHTDFWFDPIIIDDKNQAYLDNILNNNDGTITVSGWHATNQALNKKYHYIIAFDQTTGKEIGRQETSLIQRPDVAQVFPTIGNANNSGFNVSFHLTPEYSQDSIQFISRWTDDPTGNGSYIDYWFDPIQKVNYGSLDSFDLSTGHLQVTGWHANDISVYQPYHYLILFDLTSGQQVAAAQVPLLESNDVANVLPGMITAGKSRFNYKFSGIDLQANHTYSLISRYSFSNQGNSDDGIKDTYTDYWYPQIVLNQSAGHVDGYQLNGNQMSVTGWLASDARMNETTPYIIVLHDGKEITRQKLSLTARADVALVYSQIYQSLHSGFATNIYLPFAINDGDLQFVLRFSDSEDGEGNHADIWLDKINNGFAQNRYTLQNGKIIDGVLYRTDEKGKVINEINPSNIQISRISFAGDLAGISKYDKKNIKIKIALTNGKTINAWATVKWQGDSSLTWPKKCYRLKLFKDQAMTKKLKLKLPGSGFKTNSFNLKACFTDPTAGLNIVNSQLFSEMTANREGLANSIVSSMPNYGQVAGLPIELDVNNYDQGLYVLETYQEDKLYNLDDKKIDNIALSDQQTDLSCFTKPFTPDNLQEAEFEAKSPAKVDQSVADKFNELYELANADDSEYQKLESEYLDVPAAIDYLVLGMVINNIDGITKNITYINKENSKWVVMPYDLDTSWDNNWDGSRLPITADFIQELKDHRNHLLLAVYNHHQQDIINRYKELRKNVLSTENITKLFGQWFDKVGTAAYQNNDQLWGDINIEGQNHRLSISKADFNDIVAQRLNYVDSQIEW